MSLAADRGALPAPVGDGRGQRHARLVLGRRRRTCSRSRGDRGARDARRRARRSSTSAASRRGPEPAACRSTRSCGASCRCSRRSRAQPVSIDTAKAEVARRALELGAELVNDVTALRGDPELAGVVAEAGAYCCLMHMRGEPRTMQADPALRRRRLRGQGVPRGAARVRGLRGDPRGARLPRPRDRLRQDRSSTTSSSCAACPSWPRSDGRSWSASRARARSARILGDPTATVGHDGGVGRRRRRGVRPRRDDPARARRPRARRGAARGRGGRAEREDRAARPRALRPPRRPRGGARARAAVPLRRRARGRRARRRRPDRGRRRLPRGRRDRARGRRRAAFRLLEALATALADALDERFAPERVKVRVRKPDVRPSRDRRRVRGGHRRAAGR